MTADAAAPAPLKPQRRQFRRSYTEKRPPADQMARQGRLVQSAWAAFGDRDAMQAYLNGEDDALGGRPLDVALASEEGLARVERAMAALPTPVR